MGPLLVRRSAHAHGRPGSAAPRAPAGAATITLDFEEEPLGLYHPGFLSSECGCVQLLEDHGLEPRVRVIDFSLGSRALLIGDEGGALRLEFLVPVFGVQIDFYTYFGLHNIFLGDARLQAFAGDDPIGLVVVPPDPQGAVFQTISLSSSVAITRAIFTKAVDDGLEPQSPIVDNLVLTVPEPAFGLGVLALGVLAARATRSHRRH